MVTQPIDQFVAQMIGDILGNGSPDMMAFMMFSFFGMACMISGIGFGPTLMVMGIAGVLAFSFSAAIMPLFLIAISWLVYLALMKVTQR